MENSDNLIEDERLMINTYFGLCPECEQPHTWCTECFFKILMEDKGLDEIGPYEQAIFDQRYGLCPECYQSNTFDNWCKDCNSKKFQQNFGNWTSGNEHIDNFIQEAQLKARNRYELLEWIPYDKLRNIQFLAKGGFSTVYKGIWLDGHIRHWNYEKQDWKRKLVEIDEQDYEDTYNPKVKNPLKNTEKYGYPVVLKSLNDSLNINEDFLNEWKLHLQCLHKAWSNFGIILPLIGITLDPVTLNYVIVMFMANGSLRNNLSIKKYNPNDRFCNLYEISKQLEAIHKLNYVHGDLHDGNILCADHTITVISDLGLCRMANQPNIKNEICGVLPYIAPEVLRGGPYTKAADIYSLGIIMWEMSSGIPAFHNIPHDLHLSLDICKGTRPEIIKGTMPKYAELMKKCWDTDPKERPTAHDLRLIFERWKEIYPIEKNKEKRISVPENEPKIIYHPNSYYTSRTINYSVKLNELLAQDELSNKIIIMDDNDNYNDEKIISNSIADCVIKDTVQHP